MYRRRQRVLQGRVKWDTRFHPFSKNQHPYATYPCNKCHLSENDAIHNVTAFGKPLGNPDTHMDELILGVISNIPENMINKMSSDRRLIFSALTTHLRKQKLVK